MNEKHTRINDVTLAGRARRRSNAASVLRLRVLNNPELLEIIVGVRTAAFQDLYDPVSSTANVRLPPEAFDALLAAVPDEQTIWTSLVYDRNSYNIDSFSWEPSE